jgi:hypothetical protein
MSLLYPIVRQQELNGAQRHCIESEDGSCRFLLGEHQSQNVLLFIGINPSTASITIDDPTIRRVRRFASDLGYSGWAIANLYPLRATEPSDLPAQANPDAIEVNRQVLSYFVTESRVADVVFCWGTNVTTRAYLAHERDRLAKLFTEMGVKLYSLGPLSKNGHPKHPLYLSADTKLQLLQG